MIFSREISVGLSKCHIVSAQQVIKMEMFETINTEKWCQWAVGTHW